MAVEAAVGMPPVMGFALVGALGVGAQWLAWRLRMPAIVLMLVAGLAVGPGLGIFDPERDIGPLMQPMIAIAVAIILFEGGLTLNLESLRGRCGRCSQVGLFRRTARVARVDLGVALCGRAGFGLRLPCLVES